MKTCTGCEISLPTTSFYKKARGLTSRCKSCTNAENQKWREANREKIRLANHEWYLANRNPEGRAAWKAANKEKVVSYRRTYLLKRYDLTTEEYDELLATQNGRCAICNTQDPGKRGSFNVDHDHETGEVRGLLCWPCNVTLGHMKDDPDRLMAAAAYLLQSQNILLRSFG